MTIMNSKDKKHKGFTIAELLMVVVIIGVLVAVAVPIFINQLEKSRNAVDMHTAKTIANAITYYFLDNPDALAKLTAECDKQGGNHYVQVSVGREGPDIKGTPNTNTAIALELRPALNQAGLIGEYTSRTDARFTEITCKSKTKWKGYRVAVSNYSGTQGKPGDLEIYYWGVPENGKVHDTNSLGAYQTGNDPTGFKNAMRGV